MFVANLELVLAKTIFVYVLVAVMIRILAYWNTADKFRNKILLQVKKKTEQKLVRHTLRKILKL